MLRATSRIPRGVSAAGPPQPQENVSSVRTQELELMSAARTQSIVMTVIGPDRPGLVESLSAVIVEHRANWEQSRMVRLAGQFAGVLRVSADTGQVEALTVALTRLETSGLRVSVVVDSGAEPTEARARGGERVFHLELVGHDRPGIVKQGSEAIATRGVNVEELSTECASAAKTGESLFRAKARLSVPGDISSDELHAILEKVAADLVVDIEIAAEE